MSAASSGASSSGLRDCSLHAWEMEQVLVSMGSELALMASGVAKLFVSNPSPGAKKGDPNSAVNRFPGIKKGKWKPTSLAGALVLALHRPTDSMYFLMYNITTFKLMFEYELYQDIDYIEQTDRLHCFEMDDLMAGFAFAGSRTAKQFFVKVKMMKPTSKGPSPVNLLVGGGTSRAAKGRATGNGKGATVLDAGSIDHLFGGGAPAEAPDVSDSVWNSDGTLNINHIPTEWRKLLKKAGFRKADLKNPEMQSFIISSLEELGISTQPPPADLTPQQVEQYWNAEQLQQYQQYQRELELYEAQVREYEQQVREYEAYQREERGLSAWERSNNAASSRISFGTAPAGAAVRNSLSRLTGARPRGATTMPSAKAAPPPLPARKKKPTAPSKPDKRKTRAPTLPPLPPLPEYMSSRPKPAVREDPDVVRPAAFTPQRAKPSNKRQSLLQSMRAAGARAPSAKPMQSQAQRPNPDGHRSRVFLDKIKGGGVNLRPTARQSVLPDLRSVRKETKDNILAKLREGLDARRQQLHVEEDVNDGDDDDEWSTG